MKAFSVVNQMDLHGLITGLERGPASPGFEIVRAWIAEGPAERAGIHCSLEDDALFWLLARHLAYDCSKAPRIHVQCGDAAPLAWLARVSIPDSVIPSFGSLQDRHGLCYTIGNADLARLDGVKGFRSPCFVASSGNSGVFALKDLAELPPFDLYAQWMQAAGAALHAALWRGEIEMVQKPAERVMERLVEYYRGMGAIGVEAEKVMALARERCIWRAAGEVIKGGTVKQLVCGKVDVAWAARQLPGALFPKGLGEKMRKLIEEIGYPERARFHAVYHDLMEDVDYNYVAVPLEAFDFKVELAPVDVFLKDAQGPTEIKRTLPVVQVLKFGFPKRVLVLRQFLDWVLEGREGIERALTTCTAS